MQNTPVSHSAGPGFDTGFSSRFQLPANAHPEVAVMARVLGSCDPCGRPRLTEFAAASCSLSPRATADMGDVNRDGNSCLCQLSASQPTKYIKNTIEIFLKTMETNIV